MPDFELKDRYDLNDFRRLVAVLRAPGGCPWDAEQTHESIRRCALEETYELCHAIDTGDNENLKEELGDVLLQVLLHSRMEEEAGRFDLDDVADAACRKLIFRHPHVFGSAAAASGEDALDVWDAAKRAEKGQKTAAEAMASVPENLPALWRAEKMQSKAAKAGFEWPDVGCAIEKLREETEELAAAVAEGDADHIEEELGDTLFAAVKVGRFCGTDPETALHRCCEKFLRRFSATETLCAARGEKLAELSAPELERRYREAKSAENG